MKAGKSTFGELFELFQKDTMVDGRSSCLKKYQEFQKLEEMQNLQGFERFFQLTQENIKRISYNFLFFRFKFVFASCLSSRSLFRQPVFLNVQYDLLVNEQRTVESINAILSLIQITFVINR
ncbi:hypothetical protein [uncultured Desulfobacter sp.]|uniref:hypothetical protein n=1 Tax=uncultured Desulfobacter sp. TaxID=240139 RepID=UPI0029C7139A|nr:hypothetical protein [uncultured Desulfobacter sp.]